LGLFLFAINAIFLARLWLFIIPFGNIIFFAGAIYGTKNFFNISTISSVLFLLFLWLLLISLPGVFLLKKW